MKGIAKGLLALSLPALLLLSSSYARADEPVRPAERDPGIYPPAGTGGKLMLYGALTTGIWYGAATGFSFLWPDAPGAKDLRIPVAGPWMALADTGCADDDPDCSTFIVVLRAILTTIDGVAQAGGVAVMLEGAFMPVDDGSRPAPRRRKRRTEGLSVTPAPVSAGKHGLGLGLVGVF